MLTGQQAIERVETALRITSKPKPPEGQQGKISSQKYVAAFSKRCNDLRLMRFLIFLSVDCLYKMI